MIIYYSQVFELYSGLECFRTLGIHYHLIVHHLIVIFKEIVALVNMSRQF